MKSWGNDGFKEGQEGKRLNVRFLFPYHSFPIL